MATPSMMTPPPGDSSDGSSPSPGTPTTPPGASPSPAQPAPVMQQTTQSLISVVNTLRGIAKAFPEASPHVQEANEAIRRIMAAIMKNSQQGEPAAPPTNA